MKNFFTIVARIFTLQASFYVLKDWAKKKAEQRQEDYYV